MTVSDSDPTHGATAIDEPNPVSFYAAVGIPQGMIADPSSGEIAGAVRRGGELVSLDPPDYGLWLLLLAPIERAAVVEAASSNGLGDPEAALAGLADQDLLITIRPGEAMDDDLARLRPIPLGVGLGNLGGDHTRFEIQNSTLSLPSPVSVDPASIMLWWEFDATRSLREIVPDVSSVFPDLSQDLVETAATRLVHGLMVRRLLYLDYSPSPRA